MKAAITANNHPVVIPLKTIKLQILTSKLRSTEKGKRTMYIG